MSNPQGRNSGRGITDGADAVLTHHTVIRDGSWWLCTRCRRVLAPFGAGMPETAADFTPRRWGDGAA